MALSERSRSALYQSLTAVVPDEQAVQEMLSYFPARDVEEPVTKDFLRAEIAVFRAEVQVEFAELRSELRSEMQGGLNEVRVELRDALRQQTQWLIGVMVTLSALVLTIAALTGR